MHEVLVSKIFNYTSTPTKNVEGQFWFNPSTNVLSRFNGTVWKSITVSSDDVAVLTDGNKVSLTNYLNTQIAALAEGIDSKQDKLKFYSEIDKSGDTSTDSTGSEINLKTLASHYGGSNINLTASHGQYQPGNINLKAKSFDTSSGGNIILETEGGSVSGGNITLYSKFNSGGSSKPGGKINLIADGNNTSEESNILLSAKSIQLDGNLKGAALNTSMPSDPDDNHILTTKAVKTELDEKQNKFSNPGFLILNNGYAISECKPTFSSAQSLLFTYEVSESELGGNDIWSIIGNIRVWDSKKGIGIAKNRSNQWQCGFNWGYGQNGDTTSRAFLNVAPEQFADGKPHAWALVCGKNETNGFFKLYRDGVLIDSKMSLALFDDFTPEYGFCLGKHQISGASDTSAKGKIANIAFFNFDVSASDADYTLADYQSGKSIPPSFNLTTPQVLLDLKESTVANVQWYTRRADAVQYSGVWEDGSFVLKNTADTTVNAEMKQVFYIRPYITLSETLPVGALVEVSFDDWVFNTTYFSQSSEIPATEVSNQRFYGWLTVGTSPEMSNFGHGKVRSDKKFKLYATAASKQLYFSNYGFALLNSVSVGDVIPANTVFWQIKGLKIKVNGAVLNLENYTKTQDSNTKIIKDLSFGKYDATIVNDIHDNLDSKFESVLSTKQNSLIYYTEDTTKSVSKLSSSKLEVSCNSEFSKTVKANTFQIGEQVSATTGVSYWDISKLRFDTPAGNAEYAYNGIEVTNAFFKVHGNNGSSEIDPYIQIPDGNGHSFKIWKGTETEFKALTAVSLDTVYLRVQENNRIKATVGTDTASLENITDSYTLSSTSLTSFITDTKYNNAQGSILITPSLTNSGALIFGENITDTSKGFPLYPDNIVSIPFKNITNFKVAGSINDSFNYIVSFD